MLIILFGATAEMGKRSREYLKEKGYEIVQKYNYVPDYLSFVERFKRRRMVSKEEVMACDFVYKNGDMLVGFNKDQILEAVIGKKKCLLTASTGTIDFIRQIKAAYGDYVTVIGTYIDSKVLMEIFKKMPNMYEEEMRRREDISSQVKQVLLSEQKLFDYTVIYGGEDSVFNLDALQIQYDHMLECIERVEHELNNKKYAEMPYSGNEDYIFVSYSHADEECVLPILHKLQLSGHRIWYDEGIDGGENWRKIIASKIESEKCKEFLLFSSENSVSARNVRAEINLALYLEKKITTVRLDNARFGTDIEMYLSIYQYLMLEDTNFDEKLKKALDDTTRIREDYEFL